MILFRHLDVISNMDQRNLTMRMFLFQCLLVVCVLWRCEAVVFTDQPQSLTVPEGTSIILSCAVDQTENVAFSWTFNDFPVEDSSRIFMDISNNLKIGDVSKEDAGQYRCVVEASSPPETITSEPAVINVTWISDEVRVQLKSPSLPEDVEEGVRVTLICRASGNPVPDITWYHDQTLVTAGTNIDFIGSKMKIKSTTALDSGTYSCQASNAAGSALSTENVQFNIVDSNTPVVEVAPTDALRVLGDSLMLHCQFSGDPTPPVEWYIVKDGESPLALINDTETGTYILGNGSLSLDNLVPTDEGVFQCVCNSPHGRPYASARLTIATVNPLPEFETQLIPEGNTKTINCSYPSGDEGGIPAPTLRWLKPSLREVPADGTKRVRVEEQRSRLVFNPIKKSDEGNYTCVSSNIAGETTQILKVVVATVPKITTKPVDIHIKERQEAILRCNATGTPTPTISWTVGNRDVSNKRGVDIMADGSLVISSAVPQHNGTYTCRAATIAGIKTASATIFVKAILKFNPRPIAVTSLDRGEMNRLVCHATASIPPHIVWYKQGLIGSWPDHITEPSVGVLEFNPAEASDAGTYICIASTGLERINTTIKIDVVVKPKFVIIPNNTVGFEGYSLKIDCTAYGDPEPTITWISKPINNNPDHFTHLPNGTLIIQEVHANDAGKYQCIAGSDAGLNTTEITLSVQKGTPPDQQPVATQVMTRTIAIAVGCAAAYIFLVVGLMLWCRQRRRRYRRKMKNMEKPNGMVAGANNRMLNDCHDGENGKVADGEIALSPTPNKNHQRGSYDKLQFPRHDMQTITTIGHGAYGEVTLARAAGIKDGEEATTVMVKALQTKEESLQLDFRREIEMLGKLNHENIVKLLGVCRDSEPQLMITEYLDWGDLKQFLQATRGENGTKNVPPPLTLSQKIDIVNQVALGMETLSANRFIHGDLAARNCLLSPSMEVKICTMSVSQDLYRPEYHEYHQKLIPVRWMPAEAIFEDELSAKSDVWAYGIFVWEVFSQGLLPYSQLDNDAVMRAMIDGELMLETPPDTPEEVELMMHRCWADSPKDRHSFSEITHHLGRISTDSRV